MKTIELFCGTKSFSKVMAQKGHQTFTTDIDLRFAPDICADILTAKIDFPYRPDILWASPPCQTFSVASIYHYWTEGKPKNEKCLHGIAILDKTIEIIAELKPRYWFIENPRAMMRKVIDEHFSKWGIEDYTRRTISYCQYGSKIQKPTDIWTNANWWIHRPICKPGASCHERAGRGAKSGTQGIYNPVWEKERGGAAIERGRIPEDLFEEILTQLKTVNQ